MATNPGSFADLGKEAKEALFKSRDFNTKDQLNVTTTSDNGVKVNGKLTREDAGKIAGQVEFKFPKDKNTGLEGSATFDNKGKTKLAVSSTDKLVPGLKATAGVELLHANDEKKRDLQLIAEFKNLNIFTNNKLTIPVTPSGPNFSALSVLSATVVGVPERGLNAGVEIDYNVGEHTVRSANVAGQYKNANFTLTAFSRQVFDVLKAAHTCGAQYYMRVPNAVFSNAEVAGELEYDILKHADNVTVALAGGWDLNATSRVNIKADSRGRSTAIFTHAVNKNAKIRLGADVSLDSLTVGKSFLELSFFD